MNKVILFLTTFSILGFGFDKILVDAQLSILPQIISLNKDNRIFNGKYNIVVISPTKDISEYMKSKIKATNIDIISANISDYSKYNSSIYYIYNISPNDLNKVAQHSKMNKVPVFVYDMADLEDGGLISLSIEKKAIIYLNRDVLRDTKITFIDTFYKVVRFVE
jgi:hypothetical protein